MRSSRWDRRALLLVIVCLALNWLGDSLDGTLARVRHHERPRYGFYVDHMVDIFGAVALMCGLGCSGLLHWPVAIAMLIAFLLLSARAISPPIRCRASSFRRESSAPPRFAFCWSPATWLLLRNPYATLFGHRMLLFDLGGTIGAAAMFAMAIAVAVRHTAELYRQERVP